MNADLVPVPQEGINHLFRELRKSGLIAKQNLADCGSCGFSAMADEAKTTKNAAKVGYVFTHEQSRSERGDLYIQYGVTVAGRKEGYSAEDVGRIIADTATKLGLPWRWDGSSHHCVNIGNWPVN